MAKKYKSLEEAFRGIEGLTRYYGHAIWMMLCWARGVRDLRRIHNLLDPEFQLLREDQEFLDEVWKLQHGGKTSREGGRPEDSVILRCMRGVLRRQDVCTYFKSKFPRHRSHTGKHSVWVKISQVHHRDLRKSGGLLVSLTGLPTLWGRCKIDHTTASLWVTLTLEDKDLSEPVVRALLAHHVLKKACHGLSRSQSPEELAFSFQLSSQGVTDFLGEFHETSREWEDDFFPATEGVLPLLHAKLLEAGLEGVELTPFEYEEHQWYCEACRVRGILEYSPYGDDHKNAWEQAYGAHWNRQRPGTHYKCDGPPRVLAEVECPEKRAEIMEAYVVLESWCRNSY